mmetsp:Transcript_21989/g.49541  ORF Transcript_21989/g.49541 Transcript_21989/m.49541 type:complete len:237 (-) Transcript_21989:696-1406(-)
MVLILQHIKHALLLKPALKNDAGIPSVHDPVAREIKHDTEIEDESRHAPTPHDHLLAVLAERGHLGHVADVPFGHPGAVVAAPMNLIPAESPVPPLRAELKIPLPIIPVRSPLLLQLRPGLPATRANHRLQNHPLGHARRLRPEAHVLQVRSENNSTAFPQTDLHLAGLVEGAALRELGHVPHGGTGLVGEAVPEALLPAVLLGVELGLLLHQPRGHDLGLLQHELLEDLCGYALL